MDEGHLDPAPALRRGDVVERHPRGPGLDRRPPLGWADEEGDRPRPEEEPGDPGTQLVSHSEAHAHVDVRVHAVLGLLREDPDEVSWVVVRLLVGEGVEPARAHAGDGDPPHVALRSCRPPRPHR